MVKSIIEGLTDYFLQCPLLKDGVFRVDALGSDPVEYALETGMTSPVVRTYVDGSSIRQYQFNFNNREAYSPPKRPNHQLCWWNGKAPLGQNLCVSA